MVRAARCVVLPHGATLANLMYRVGRPTGLVELFPGDPDYLRRVYGPWLSRAAGFVYRAVVGSELSRTAEASPSTRTRSRRRPRRCCASSTRPRVAPELQADPDRVLLVVDRHRGDHQVLARRGGHGEAEFLRGGAEVGLRRTAPPVPRQAGRDAVLAVGMDVPRTQRIPSGWNAEPVTVNVPSMYGARLAGAARLFPREPCRLRPKSTLSGPSCRRANQPPLRT